MAEREAAERKDLPIDKGWAWVITFACFGLFGFVASSNKSQGLVLVELQEIFPDRSVKEILWLFSMTLLCNRITAPINGLLLTKTSHRTVGLIGTTLMTGGLIGFAYLPSLDYMYPIYGFGYGAGAGMATLTAFTAYAPYFDKKKALSVGITASGSGSLTITAPFILRALFENFSFSGAMLIYAGIIMQMFICASLLRPMSFYENLARRKETNNSQKLKTEEGQFGCNNNLQTVEPKGRERSFSTGDEDWRTIAPTAKFLSTPDVTAREPNQGLFLNAYSIQDISASGLVYPLTVEREVDGEQKPTANWRLAYDYRCILLCLSTFLFFSGFSVVYQCIPPLAVQSGAGRGFAATALTVGGGVEVVSRIFNGWLADRKLMSIHTHIIICMAITGTMALLCAGISGEAGIVLMLVGAATGGTPVMNLLPIVNGEVFGKANLSVAMSINYFYQGVAIIAGTYTAGAMFEATERWKDVFFYIGGCNLAGSLLMLFTLLIARYQAKRNGIF